MAQYQPGQRWISDSEAELGLGTILTEEGRLLTVLYPATGETRQYATRNAPLTRVRFAPGDEITHFEGWKLTVQEVEGHGRQEGEVEYVRGRAIRPRLIARLQVSVAINQEYVDPAIEAIQRGARTGKVGDGKIFVLPLERCVRIRTGQEGADAI